MKVFLLFAALAAGSSFFANSHAHAGEFIGGQVLESYEGIVDIETQSYGCILFLRNGSSVYGLVEDFASGCPNAAAVGRGDTWAIAPEMLEPVDPTSLERLLLERVRKNISNLKRNEKALPAVYYRIKTK